MTTPMDLRIAQKYNLGSVKSWVEEAAYFLGLKHGIQTIGGYRKASFGDHPLGLALDFMTRSKTQGDALASDAVANAQALGITYVIWWRQIWTPSRGWHVYTGTSNPHTDHVHVSFLDRPGTGLFRNASMTAITPIDETCAWSIRGPSATVPDWLPGSPNLSTGQACIASKVQARQLLGGLLLVAGGLVFTIGLVLLMAYGLKETGPGQATTDALEVLQRVVKKG